MASDAEELSTWRGLRTTASVFLIRPKENEEARQNPA
jgi:hypothetical protein